MYFDAATGRGKTKPTSPLLFIEGCFYWVSVTCWWVLRCPGVVLPFSCWCSSSPAVCAERVHTWCCSGKKVSVSVQNHVALPGVLTWVQIGTPWHPRNPAGLFWDRVHLYFVRCGFLLCRDKSFSAGCLYESGRGKFPWALKEHGVLSTPSDIFETRQCLSAEDLRAGSSCAQLWASLTQDGATQQAFSFSRFPLVWTFPACLCKADVL